MWTTLKHMCPVAIAVEISKADFSTCSSSQFIWIRSLTKTVEWLTQMQECVCGRRNAFLFLSQSKHIEALLWSVRLSLYPPGTTLGLSASLSLLTWQWHSDCDGCHAKMGHGKKCTPRFLVLLSLVFHFMRQYKENVLAGLCLKTQDSCCCKSERSRWSELLEGGVLRPRGLP